MNQGRRLEEERKKKMKIEQYVMAYGVEHDRLRAILPDGFISPRPVLRINAEIREEKRDMRNLILQSKRMERQAG